MVDQEAKCACCGKLYEPTRNRDGSLRKVKYLACSPACINSMRRRARIAEKVCEHCGYSMIEKGKALGKYCSKECKKSAIKKREKAQVELKRCCSCKQEKHRGRFHSRSASIDGLSPMCKECCAERSKARYSRRKAAGEKINKKYSELSQEERNKLIELKAKYRRQAGARSRADIAAEADKKKRFDTRCLWERNAVEAFQYWLCVRCTDEQAERYWSATGKPWKNPRLTEADKYSIRYRLDAEFNVKERIRCQLRKAKTRSGIGELMRGAIRRGGSSRKVKRELGYSIADLVKHIEKQFVKGMNWQKFKAGEIHIDHIIPQASFDLADDSQWRSCWALSNLRPMWADENIRKSDAILFLC